MRVSNFPAFVVTFALIGCSCLTTAAAQEGDEQSIDDVKAYLAEKLSGLEDEQLGAIAKRIDADGNGKVSESEFENRMDAVQAVMSADAEPVDGSDEKAEVESDEAEQATAPLPYSRMAYTPISKRADVLLVTSAELAESWKAFANWKTSTGRPTKIVTTEFIAENFSGDDIQQKIRACCLKHIDEEQTRWVVLGGDSSEDAGVVPDRDTDHSDCQMLPYDNIPTDLYYISEKDWDANDDGKYGVFADDMEEVAYYNPNASIGRIPVRTTDDVAAYTEKVIAYESRYPVGDFARKMVYTCPSDSAYPKLETSMEEVSKVWSSGYVSRFFGNRTAWDETKRGEYDLTPENWIKMINDRHASKVHMHGHGLLDLWVLEKNKEVKADQVDELKNENAYPIITTVSCLTGQYDDKQDPCITESMLRQPRAGAIAILAPSREGVPFMKSQEDFQLMMTEGKMDGTTTAYTKFWKIALTEDLTLGEAFRKVKMEMESDARENDGFHMAQCELNLLGDPTLSVRPVAPESFQARATLRDNKLKLRGVPNATVSIWDGKGQYIQKQANDKGRLEVELKPTEGMLYVAASAPGHNIWSKTIAVEEPKVATADAKSDSDDEKAAASTSDMKEEKGQTLSEFKDYVSGKIPDLSDDQLDEIAKAADANSDGKISESEFENRMEAIESALGGEG